MPFHCLPPVYLTPRKLVRSHVHGRVRGGLRRTRSERIPYRGSVNAWTPVSDRPSTDSTASSHLVVSRFRSDGELRPMINVISKLAIQARYTDDVCLSSSWRNRVVVAAMGN